MTFQEQPVVSPAKEAFDPDDIRNRSVWLLPAKHCLIWTNALSIIFLFDKIKEIMKPLLLTKEDKRRIGRRMEFLHPDAMDIMAWFKKKSSQPTCSPTPWNREAVIEAVERNPPQRLFISVDGDRDSYLHMQGKDGYDGIIKVLEQTHRNFPSAWCLPYRRIMISAICSMWLKWPPFGLDMRIGV